jgi:hypothetical protein
MSEYVVSDTYAHLLQPDTILPSQYFSALQRKGAQEPERRLAVAILQDAIECFQKHACSRDRKARQLFLDAEDWIREEDRSWPFSFENICELLQINSGYLRRGLLAWKEGATRSGCGGRVAGMESLSAEAALDDQPFSSASGR